jgi:hypothetical protein
MTNYANPRPQHDTRARTGCHGACAEPARSRGRCFLGVMGSLFGRFLGVMETSAYTTPGRGCICLRFLGVIDPASRDRICPSAMFGSWRAEAGWEGWRCRWWPRAYRAAEVVVDAITRESCVHLRVDRAVEHMTDELTHRHEAYNANGRT